MSMYLSRVALDTAKRATMRALSSPSIFHGAVESSFAGERLRNLWRIDKLNGQMYFLLLSSREPDLKEFNVQFGYDGRVAETKNYDQLLDRIAIGGKWRFRLTANPTKAVKSADGSRGKVVAHITNEYAAKWLLEKAEKNGFLLQEDSFEIVESSWQRFYKKDNKHAVTLRKVTYEGILEINDAELFKTALINGIGRGKAYGMGMLTIMH